MMSLPWLAALTILLFAASPLWANSIAPAALFLPGILPMSIGLALPASVLAAFLERPFWAAAGISKHPLVLSLQANLVSLIGGFVLLPCLGPMMYAYGFFAMPLPIVVSIVSERYYLRRQVGKLRWLPIIAGNLFSSFVIAVLPSQAVRVNQNHPSWEWELSPYHEGLLGRVDDCSGSDEPERQVQQTEECLT